MYKYPKIQQFRQVIRAVSLQAAYTGKDENGEPVYVKPHRLPVVEADVTVKLHGTNSAVVLTADGEFYCQSKNRVITPTDDNAAFARYVYESGLKDFLVHHMTTLQKAGFNGLDIVVYGEWCCGNIQKKVGLSLIPEKHFIVFGAKAVDNTGDEPKSWWIRDLSGFYVTTLNMYPITYFPTYTITIDFNKPEVAQNLLLKFMNSVESRCPVADQLIHERDIQVDPDQKLVGEGVVVKFEYDGNHYAFKVKGDEHTTTKVKKLNPVDEEKQAKINDVAQLVTPAWRLEQAFKEVCNDVADRKFIGDFLRWVNKDIAAEEADVLTEAGLNMKQVGSVVSKIAREWFFERETEV